MVRSRRIMSGKCCLKDLKVVSTQRQASNMPGITKGSVLHSCWPPSHSAGMMLILGVSSLAISLLDLKPYAHLQITPHLTKYYQVS